MLNNVCAVMIAVISACLCSATSAQPLDAGVAAIRVGATDLAESSVFYREHFGFQTLMDASEHGYIVLENHGVLLVLTPAEEPARISDEECFVAINFRTDDLDETAASLRASGIEMIGQGESAVGTYVTLLDPSGNRLHVKELFDEHPDGPAGDLPRVYNLGVRVTDIDEALAFYEGLLGFEIVSRDYYPPVIPMQNKGNVSFILSESAARHSTDDHRGIAFAGMAFEVPDVSAAMTELGRRGARVLDDTPIRAGNVIHAAFRDPFGNVHELIQHVAPVEPRVEVDQERTAIVSIEDLSWMQGVWRGDSGGDVLEETWSAADGDAMIGMFRWSRSGHVWLYELMAIEQDEDGIVFRLRHFSRGLTPWKSEPAGPLTYPLRSARDSEVVFENPEREQPRRFVYRREGRTLVIRIEGPDGSGDEFRLERVDR